MNFQQYRNLLSETKKFYSFEIIQIGAESKASFLNQIGKKVCFLRHDIDFSPQNALTIAKLEHELNVSATYTVLLSGNNYNAFEPEIRKQLKAIHKLNHQIGLHFDPSAYDVEDKEGLEYYLTKEKSILESLLDRPIDMFSFHNTNKFSLGMNKSTYAGMENAYSSFYQNEVEYVSDSNGYWRHRDWQQLLNANNQKIQILTHPIWWMPNNNLPPFETILYFYFNRFSHLVEQYVEMFEGQSDRINVSLINTAASDVKDANKKELFFEYALHQEVLAILSKRDEKNLLTSLENYVENVRKK